MELKEKIKKEQKEFEAQMKAAKEATEGGGGDEKKKAKKQVKIKDEKDSLTIQAFEKKIATEEMLGTCPLKYRPIMSV
jgi:hypothetical protein